MVEHLTVAQVAAGSNPVTHPMNFYMYPEEGGHMERKIVFIIIFSVLIISNVFCIATIIRINRGLTQLEKGKEETEVRIDSFIKSGTKEIDKRNERNLVIVQEIERRLDTLERREGDRARSGGPERIREIEERLAAVERHGGDQASRWVEGGRKIEERLSEFEQRMKFRTKEEGQIEKRLDAFERHGGDQARRCVEDVRGIEKELKKLEQRMGECFRELERRISK